MIPLNFQKVAFGSLVGLSPKFLEISLIITVFLLQRKSTSNVVTSIEVKLQT
jgi:hypothetical protein